MNKVSNFINRQILKVKLAMLNKKGEAYVGEAVKILIAVIVGALLLVLLYVLFKDSIGPAIKNTVTNLFGKADDLVDQIDVSNVG